MTAIRRRNFLHFLFCFFFNPIWFFITFIFCYWLYLFQKQNKKCRSFFFNPISVSYTHLDVYKRQLSNQRVTLKRLLFLFLLFSSSSIASCESSRNCSVYASTVQASFKTSSIQLFLSSCFAFRPCGFSCTR